MHWPSPPAQCKAISFLSHPARRCPLDSGCIPGTPQLAWHQKQPEVVKGRGRLWIRCCARKASRSQVCAADYCLSKNLSACVTAAFWEEEIDRNGGLSVGWGAGSSFAREEEMFKWSFLPPPPLHPFAVQKLSFLANSVDRSYGIPIYFNSRKDGVATF